MSKKKVYGLISVLLIMALMFSGCGNGEKKEGEPSSKPSSSDNSNVSTPISAGSSALECEYEYVKAILKDNVLTVTILPGSSADQYLGTDNSLKYNNPYPVSGLEGKYKDIFVGSMGTDVSPFVFILTEQGTVECVPVGNVLLEWENGTQESDPVFTSIGELPGVSNITSFYEGAVSGYTTVFAVADDGTDIDLTFPYYYALNPQDDYPSEELATAIIIENAHDAGLDDILDHGIYAMASGETVYMYGEYCSLLGVGSDYTESLWQMQPFAVGSSGAVYKYDSSTEEWIPCNMPAKIYSGSEDNNDLFSIICEPNGNELNEIYFTGRMEKVVVSDPKLYSDTPMVLLPLKNNVKIKVELIDFNSDGEIISETILSDMTLSRGDVCAIYAKMMYDTSPLFVSASWQDGPSEFTVYWWAVGGSGYGETYIDYVAGFSAEPEANG